MNTTSAPMPRSASTSLVWPIMLILIGILALALPVATSLGVVRVLSWLLFFDGIVQFFYAFKSEGVGRILWKVLVALLYVVGGIYLLLNPQVGIAGFTLMLAVVFCAEGIMDLLTVLLDAGNAVSSLRVYAPLIIIALRPINEPTKDRNIGDLSPISG